MSMTREEIFEAWVPDLPEDESGMPWSNWAKPVLFASLGAPGTAASPDTEGTDQPGAGGTPAPGWERERFAGVVDLPGADAVRCGMDFAELGFRPVPLFNGCPGPSELVSTTELCHALARFAPRLRELRIDDNAPPVFLLDSNRMVLSVPRRPGLFDNRWLTLPQDFPSVNLLLARGIERALLVQQKPGQPSEDLAHVLRRWQEGGIRIAVCSPGGSAVEDLDIKKPSRFRSLWYRLGATAGLLPNSTGGFGAVIPLPSAG
jgi:hypothetical protein